MQRFVLGLIVGLIVGGGGAYLALERPWAGHAAATADAGVAVASGDAGVKGKGKGKRRRARVGVPGGGTTEVAGDEADFVDEPIPELSAADRAMGWRGERVELPPRKLDMGSADDSRPLDASEINGVIRGDSAAIIDCILKARGAAPLDVTVTMQLLVDGNGRVDKSRIQAPAYLFDHGLLACAQRAARALHFPATGAPTVVDAPYDIN